MEPEEGLHGLTPTQQLVAIRPMVLELMNDAREYLDQPRCNLDAR